MLTMENLAVYRDALAFLARDAYRTKNPKAFGFLVERYAALCTPDTLQSFYDGLTRPEADALPPEALTAVPVVAPPIGVPIEQAPLRGRVEFDGDTLSPVRPNVTATAMRDAPPPARPALEW